MKRALCIVNALYNMMMCSEFFAGHAAIISCKAIKIAAVLFALQGCTVQGSELNITEVQYITEQCITALHCTTIQCSRVLIG